jgi:hypothetical protein
LGFSNSVQFGDDVRTFSLTCLDDGDSTEVRSHKIEYEVANGEHVIVTASPLGVSQQISTWLTSTSGFQVLGLLQTQSTRWQIAVYGQVGTPITHYEIVAIHDQSQCRVLFSYPS